MVRRHRLRRRPGHQLVGETTVHEVPEPPDRAADRGQRQEHHAPRLDGPGDAFGVYVRAGGLVDPNEVERLRGVSEHVLPDGDDPHLGPIGKAHPPMAEAQHLIEHGAPVEFTFRDGHPKLPLNDKRLLERVTDDTTADRGSLDGLPRSPA